METPRSLAVRGARVMLNSINSFAPDEATLHVPVRAAENKVWVVSANKVDFLVPDGPRAFVAEALMADEDTLRGSGESMVVAPDGRIVASHRVAATRSSSSTSTRPRPTTRRVPTAPTSWPRAVPTVYGPIAAAPKGRQHGEGADG